MKSICYPLCIHLIWSNGRLTLHMNLLRRLWFSTQLIILLCLCLFSTYLLSILQMLIIDWSFNTQFNLLHFLILISFLWILSILKLSFITLFLLSIFSYYYHLKNYEISQTWNAIENHDNHWWSNNWFDKI